MKLFTREEKQNKELMNLYNEFIKEGLKPQKAVRKTKELFSKKQQI